MSKITSKVLKSKVTLKSLLSQIQLQQYLPLFQRNEIDFSTFLTLNEQSLKLVGIRNDSHRKLLLIYIKSLQKLLIPTITADNNNNMSLGQTDDDETKVSPINETILTPITEEDEQEISEITNIIQNEETTVENIENVPSTNEAQPNSTSSNDESLTSSRLRKHYSTDNVDLLAIGRQRSTSVTLARDKNWRLSTPVTISELPSYHIELPSYYDIVDRSYTKSCDEVPDELPPYSCSVYKSGYVSKKNEFSSKGYRSRDRSWKKVYFYLWGTFLRIYKSEPVVINRTVPTHEFSMQNVQIGLATDYTKKCNVIRMRFPSGCQFLFQAHDHNECVAWIESLQSSANISPPLDEREMPMFITLPMRRRRAGTISTSPAISSSSSLSSLESINYDSISVINPSAPVSASGLTFQQFNDMARELQQVQITEALPQQQLSW